MTLTELLNIEGAASASLAALIATETGLPTHAIFDGDEQESPFLALTLEVNGQTGHMKVHTLNSVEVAIPDAWNYRLVISICSRRSNGDTAAEQNLARAKVRAALLYATAKLTSTNLPTYQLVSVEEAGSRRVIDEANDFDVSELEFTGTLSVRSEVWASVTQ